MNLLPLILLLPHSLLAQSPQTNPCSNGSFEVLSPGGFPVDWGPLGRVEASSDAHSGSRSLRLLRTDHESDREETGTNAANIDRLKGGRPVGAAQGVCPEWRLNEKHIKEKQACTDSHSCSWRRLFS